MTKRNIHIHYASLAWQNGTLDNKEDITKAASLGADVVGFDELKSGYIGQLNVAAARYGYQVVRWPGNEEAFLIKKGYAIIARDRVLAVPAGNAGGTGRYPARYVSSVLINFNGARLWMHVAHWMNHVNVKGKVINGTRALAHAKITDTMISRVQLHGKSPNLSFFMGDTNVDEAGDNKINDPRFPNARFHKANMITIWDEFRVAPNTLTGHGGYDMIGSYDTQNRCKGTRYKVWPKENSDHRPISAWYDITLEPNKGVATSGGQPATPVKALPWWKSSDYLDSFIYPLPYAKADSEDG